MTLGPVSAPRHSWRGGGIHGESASRHTRWLIAIVALATVVALVGWLTEALSFVPFLVLILLEAAIAGRYASRASRALADVEERSGELETLAGLLNRIERESFRSPRLQELQDGLMGEGHPASGRIARLAGMVRWLEARHNIYFALFGTVLLWKTQFALAVESLARSGGGIDRPLAGSRRADRGARRRWRAYAFENPADPFPELVADGPIFEGSGLGHPLLAREPMRPERRRGSGASCGSCR